MSFNMSMNGGWWERTRSMRFIFLAGVFVGIFLGWMLHGVLTFILRFGLVALLMIPLLAVGFMWWRSAQERRRVETRTIMRWDSANQGRLRFEQDRGSIIDIADIRRAEATHDPQRS